VYVTTMTMWSRVQRGASIFQHSFGSQLHPVDPFFLFLHKLRGLLDQGAANKFNTAASTVSRMVITYYSWIAEHLAHTWTD